MTNLILQQNRDIYFTFLWQKATATIPLSAGMNDGSQVKCISQFRMKENSWKWQEHPSTPFTSISESCHSSQVDGHLLSLTKEHKVSESPDMCQGGGRMVKRGPVAKRTTTWRPSGTSLSGGTR